MPAECGSRGRAWAPSALLTARLGRGGRPGPELEARQNHLLPSPSQRGAQGAASVRLLSLHGWLQPTQGRERSETGCVRCRALVRGGRGERVCTGERACVCARLFPKTGCLAPARPSAAGRPVHSCGQRPGPPPQPHSFWAAASKPLRAQPRGSQFHRSDVAPWNQNSPILNLPKLISCAFPKRAASFPKTPRGRISTPLVAGQDQVPKEQSGQPEDHGEKPRARAQGSGCLSPPPAALPPARLSAMCAQLRQGRLGSLSRHVAGAGPALQVAQSLSPVPSATTSRAGSGAGCHPGGGRQGARTEVGAPPTPLPES